jgi:hypothetical protein
MSISLTLAGTIQATDNSTGTIALSKILTALLTPGTSFSETNQGSIGTSPVSLALPVSPVTFGYIKNLHATQTLSVSWTPNGGSSNPVVVLEPGSYVIFGGTVAATAGVTAISLTGSGASTIYESILAG